MPWEMPAAKLPDFARLRAGDSRVGRALALLDEDAVVGFALCDYLSESNLLHLKYLAVDPTRRNQGSGARLLHAVAAAGETIAHAAGRNGCRGVLIEVEIPDSPPPDADRSLRTRRIAFYERHGALITGVPYPRPPWAPPEQPDFELMLLPGQALAGRARRRDPARSGPLAHGRGLRRRSRMPPGSRHTWTGSRRQATPCEKCSFLRPSHPRRRVSSGPALDSRLHGSDKTEGVL